MMTRDEAITVFSQLVRLYGTQWTAKVPASAHESLRRCNEVLTEADRRKVLFNR